MQKVNWSSVRTVAELRILTRASYMLLLLTPMIAGAWTGVDAMIKGYNADLERVAERLSEASMNFSAASPGDGAQAVHSEAVAPTHEVVAIARLKGLIASIEAEELRLRRRQSPASSDLPYAWAAAFFASLAVVLAQLAYQAFAPGLVRELSEQDYVEQQLGYYERHQAAEELRQSIRHIRGYRMADAEWRTAANEAESLLTQAKPVPMTIGLRVTRWGARARYQSLARRTPTLSLVSMTLYGAGLLLLLSVIAWQAHLVGSSAGWI